MAVEIDFHENKDFEKAFNKGVIDGLRAGARAYLVFMKGFVPVLTGRLRRSFRVGALKIKNGRVYPSGKSIGKRIKIPQSTALSIKTTAPYWRYVEYGTSKQKAQPYLRPSFLAFRKRIQVIFAKEMDKQLNKFRGGSTHFKIGK